MSQEPPFPPSVQYYRSCEGRWQAPFSVRATSWAAWWRADLGLIFRLGTLALLCVARGTRACVIQTRVVCTPNGSAMPEVVHETWIRVMGVVVMASVERFALNEDGTTGDITGEQRYAPFGLLRWRYHSSHLRVAADAQSADYTFAVAGLRWQQQGRIDGDAVVLHMHNAWLDGEQRLRRC